MKSFLCVACVVMFACVGLAQTTQPGTGSEQFLLRFEPAEMDALAKTLDLEKQQDKPANQPASTVYRQKAYSSLAYYVFAGKGVGGSQALGIGWQRKPDANYYLYGDEVIAPPEALDYYGIFQNNYGAAGGLLFNTCGPFRKMFPTDWSRFDRLRFEAMALEQEQTVRVSLEDEQIGPPVIRNVVLPPGQWRTVDVDLRAAAAQRGLDPKRMASLAITVIDAKAPPKATHSVMIDNLRLSLKSVPTSQPAVRDDSPHTLPDYFRHVSKPQPEKLPVPPDRSPLPAQKPFVIPTSQPCGLMPNGWAAAYDNQRLLVGFSRGTETYVLQSLDGGANWRGLDGKNWPTTIPVPYPDHQAGRGDVVGQRADVLLFTNLGCRGTVLSALRLFTRRILFTEKGWVVQPRHALVDCDLRHCNSNQSVVRGPDGRMWEAHGLYGRLGGLCVNVRFSDDDGVTWRSSREGTSGVIPGSIRQDAEWGFGYTVDNPVIVPFGEGVACLWQQMRGYDYVGLKFARFDGKEWSDVESVPEPKRTVYNPTRPEVLAVSLGGQEIFAASSLGPGIFHYAAGKWTMELPDVPAGARISVAGDKTVVVVAAVYEGPRKGPVTLRCWQRSADGKWSAPTDLVREETPLASIEPMYMVRVSYVTQPYAPPNFVPLAWSCEGQKWVKYLRVPVR